MIAGRQLIGILDRVLVEFFRRMSPGRRLAAAVRLALRTSPLLRILPSIEDRTLYVDDRNSYTLRLILRSLTRSHCDVPATLTIEGGEILESAYRSRGRLMVLSGHFSLNTLLMQTVVRRGFRPATMTSAGGDDGIPPGVDVLRKGPSPFLEIRRRLNDGQVILLVLDSIIPLPRAIEFEMKGRRRYVSRSAFEFAKRTATPVVFGSTRLLPSGEVVARIVTPVATDPGEMAEEFRDFYLSEAARIP